MHKRVLVIDDSALARSLLTEIINSQPDMRVVGTAPDPLVARQMIKDLDPDVLTLDVEMPKMNGLEFLERLMRLRPMPVLMVSSLTERGSDATLRALELGAIDYVAKPRLGIADGIAAQAQEIAGKIRTAASARIRRRTPAAADRPAALPHALRTTDQLMVIGASTGGTEAIRTFLEALPPDAPGMLIAQHMPEAFTAAFARRLDAACAMTVKQAEGGERVMPGHVYVAPGHSHLKLERNGAFYYTALSQDAPVNRHRPSVDVLFDSAARAAGPNVIAILLTGMGRDGAQGMLHVRQAGGYTLAQDEASCVVFGMPRAAIELGAACAVAPLERLPAEALSRLTQTAGSGRAAAVTADTLSIHGRTDEDPDRR
ncbi:MAG: chemotaxis response regulator protein-glutamate methylesterase [Burkholderiaceae bacterium]|nr:chemotaxis response regulator protein-glutamate methylesterase [Burkholderiaceae bacterium]